MQVSDLPIIYLGKRLLAYNTWQNERAPICSRLARSANRRLTPGRLGRSRTASRMSRSRSAEKFLSLAGDPPPAVPHPGEQTPVALVRAFSCNGSHIVGTVPPSMTYSLPVIATRGPTPGRRQVPATSSGRAGRPSGMPPNEAIKPVRAVVVSVRRSPPIARPSSPPPPSRCTPGQPSSRECRVAPTASTSPCCSSSGGLRRRICQGRLMKRECSLDGRHVDNYAETLL